MSEYVLYRCDQCGKEEIGSIGNIGPTGWLQIQQQGEAQVLHFCTHACMVLYGHEQADYKQVPRAERLRTALQSLGLLPKTGSASSAVDAHETK